MAKTYRNPLVTADVIIEMDGRIILIKRKNPPHGWALPGGFTDYGESLEASAIREAKEETGLDITIQEQFHAYSAPDRDPRHHTVTAVFIAAGRGTPKADDDAKKIGLFSETDLPEPMAFDHGDILRHYFRYKKGEALKNIFYG